MSGVNWQTSMEFLRRWRWLLPVIVTGASAVYFTPKKLVEAWDWYLDRFWDRPVLDVLREVRIPKKLSPVSLSGSGETHPTIIAIMKHGSYSVGDLADILNRSHQSIGKSIRRLRAQGKVELDRGGFKLKK
jgi:hypothetical protein